MAHLLTTGVIMQTKPKNEDLLKHLCTLQKDRLAYADGVINDLVKVALIAEEYLGKVKSGKATKEEDTEWLQIVKQVRERFLTPQPPHDEKVPTQAPKKSEETKASA